MKSARIAAVAEYLPENILTNDQLARLYPTWSAEKIYEKTGIKERHIADVQQTSADLAFQAALELFRSGVVAPEEIDFLIFCTQTPDHLLPTSACILQHRLGLSKRVGALDINLGCSGYVYGLSLADGLIKSGAAKKVLLLTADTYSKLIHPLDKSVRTLFGDAGTASLICACEQEVGIRKFAFGTDGSGAGDLCVETGGARFPRSSESAQEYCDDSGNIRTRDHLFMNGANVLAFSLREVPKIVSEVIDKTEWHREEVDFLVLHQANKFMLDALSKKIKIPAHKVPVRLADVGNTVSSTIPLVLNDLMVGKHHLSGQKALLVGFGVGLSWAACSLVF